MLDKLLPLVQWFANGRVNRPTTGMIARMTGFIDMARLVADHVLIGGWLVSPMPPTRVRIADCDGNLVERPTSDVIWIERPDIAKLHDTRSQGDRVAFVIHLAAEALTSILGLHRPVVVTLLDSTGQVLLDGTLHILPVALEGGQIAAHEWVVEKAIDAGVFSPIVAAALRLLGSQPAPEARGYLEFGVSIGCGALLSGWIPNAAERRLLLMSGSAECCRSGSDIMFVERPDIQAAMADWGVASQTTMHAYTTSFPLLFSATRSVHIFESLGTEDSVRLIGTFELKGGNLELAYSTFMTHFGKGRFPPPEVAEYHLRPLLLGRRPAVADSTVIVAKSADKPVALSVIVPLYGRPFFVRSLFHNQGRSPENTEFIYVCDDPRLHEFVVNHFSDRSTLIQRPTKIVLNPKNLGYSASNNVGVAHAQGDVLLFQNSDIWIADPAEISEALAILCEAESFAALGFRLLYEDGTLQHDGLTFETGAAVHGMFLAEHRGKGLPPVPGEGVHETPAVTGAMLMVKRSWFDLIDGFDPGYIRGDFEDADLCLRLSEAGGTVGIVRGGNIYHLERQSISLTGGSAEQLLITYLNCHRFNQRWGDRLAGMAA